MSETFRYTVKVSPFADVDVFSQPPGGDGKSLPAFFRCFSFVNNTIHHFSVGTLHSDSCVCRNDAGRNFRFLLTFIVCLFVCLFQNLAAQKTYNNLNMSMREAIASRACCVEGVLKCYRHETLETIIDRIAKAEVAQVLVARTPAWVGVGGMGGRRGE